MQPVNGGVRRLVLHALGATAVLPGDRGQHRRPPGSPGAAIPWLQNALASHWNGQYYQSMLPVPGRLQSPLRPQHQHRHGGDLRRRPAHRHQAPGHRRPAAATKWPTRTQSNFYPINGSDQQRGIGNMSGRYPGMCTTATPVRRSATTPGRCPRPTSPSCTTGWPSRSRRPGRSSRQPLRRLLQPGRGRRVDHAGRGRRGASGRRGPDASGGSLPQR